MSLCVTDFELVIIIETFFQMFYNRYSGKNGFLCSRPLALHTLLRLRPGSVTNQDSVREEQACAYHTLSLCHFCGSNPDCCQI